MSGKIALLSDVHGNILALEAVLLELDRLEIKRESTYVLGDLVGYGPRPNEVLECLMNENIISILGNYDEAVGFYLPTCGCKENSIRDKMRMENALGWTSQTVTESNKAYLRSLEESLEIKEHGIHICLTHGSPFSINEYVYEEDMEKHDDILQEVECTIVAMGHTHIPFVKRLGNRILVNPGSVGRPKDGDNRASFIVIEVKDDPDLLIEIEVIRLSYDYHTVAREIRESDLLDEFAQHIELGLVDE